MPYIMNDDGLAEQIPWSDGRTPDKAVFETPTHEGRFFPSLGSAVLSGGLQVSVFDKPLRVEALYDAKTALDRKPGEPMPPVVGHRANYRVAILDGTVRHPPLHPADILAERREKPLPEVETTPEDPDESPSP